MHASVLLLQPGLGPPQISCRSGLSVTLVWRTEGGGESRGQPAPGLRLQTGEQEHRRPRLNAG